MASSPKIKLSQLALILSCIFFSLSARSWDALGHKVVAQIAWDNLSAHSRLRFSAYNRVLSHAVAANTWLDAAVWLDTLHSRALSQLRPMHYIDLPVAFDGSSLKQVKANRMNAVLAYQQALIRLNAPLADAVERAIALRILLHVVGDLHQPMHAVTCVSKQHPEGDRGGNLTFLRKNSVSRNLHQYWDRGAGVLSGSATSAHVRKIARQIETRYPCNQLSSDANPTHWAQESHQIAVNEIYPQLQQLVEPQGMINARQRVQQQLALAGCRLAMMLNTSDFQLADKLAQH